MSEVWKNRFYYGLRSKFTAIPGPLDLSDSSEAESKDSRGETLGDLLGVTPWKGEFTGEMLVDTGGLIVLDMFAEVRIGVVTYENGGAIKFILSYDIGEQSDIICESL